MYNSLEDVCKKISELVLPISWLQENVEVPNWLSRMNAYTSCVFIFKSLKLFPNSIACTKENGVFISYTKYIFYFCIETYNNGEIGLIISDDSIKSVIYSEDIKDFNFDNIIKIFSDCLFKYQRRDV